MSPLGENTRSVAFLDHEGTSWACYLVTRAMPSGQWHGHLSFRSANAEADGHEVRTAEIFIEGSEAAIHQKARGLGRPLLGGLLASALHTSARTRPGLGRRFRELIGRKTGALPASDDGAADVDAPWKDHGDHGDHGDEADDADHGADGDVADHGHRRDVGAGGTGCAPAQDGTRADVASRPAAGDDDALRSLYASYRLDQVAHFICLVTPEAFENAVDHILEGERVDFRTKDRIQFAMMVVSHIERHLPLPPFDVWAEDYRAHPDDYRLYTHTLHREGRLP